MSMQSAMLKYIEPMYHPAQTNSFVDAEVVIEAPTRTMRLTSYEFHA